MQSPVTLALFRNGFKGRDVRERARKTQVRLILKDMLPNCAAIAVLAIQSCRIVAV